MDGADSRPYCCFDAPGTHMCLVRTVQYSRVYWEITSADPFTQAQLKELTLARGFKPGFHGATTLPMYSHLTRGGYACPLALSRVLAGLVLRAQL